MSLFVAALFFVLTPGVLLRLPAGGSKMMVAATHAVVFALIYSLTHNMVINMVHGREGFGSSPAAKHEGFGSSPAAKHEGFGSSPAAKHDGFRNFSTLMGDMTSRMLFRRR